MNELRTELEARNLSSKGLKSQLIARLLKAVKSEVAKEDSIAEVFEAAITDQSDAGCPAEKSAKKVEVAIFPLFSAILNVRYIAYPLELQRWPFSVLSDHM